MKTLLTPILLDFLIIEGYKYCLSKAGGVNTPDASESITLIPLKSKRLLKQLSGSVDKYFSIRNEPVQMAEGFDDTLIMVEIDSNDLKRYINYFMEKLALSKQFFNTNLQNEC